MTKGNKTKKYMIITGLFVLLVSIILVLLARTHFERNCYERNDGSGEVCFMFGQVSWEFGEFPNSYQFHIDVGENMDFWENNGLEDSCDVPFEGVKKI